MVLWSYFMPRQLLIVLTSAMAEIKNSALNVVLEKEGPIKWDSVPNFSLGQDQSKYISVA